MSLVYDEKDLMLLNYLDEKVEGSPAQESMMQLSFACHQDCGGTFHKEYCCFWVSHASVCMSLPIFMQEIQISSLICQAGLGDEQTLFPISPGKVTRQGAKITQVMPVFLVSFWKPGVMSPCCWTLLLLADSQDKI